MRTASLRLGVNRVDTLVIHDLDRNYHDDTAVFDTHCQALKMGGFKALRELKDAGEIEAIGAGVNTSEMIAPMAEELDLDFLLVAMPYTLLDQSALSDGFAACAANKVSVVIGAPYASGLLATGLVDDAKYNYGNASPEIILKTRVIIETCERHGVALPAAALQFVLAHPLVASVIPGAVSAKEVGDNLRHLSASIPAAFWSDLKSKGLIEDTAPTP